MSGGFEFLRETQRTRHGNGGDDEWLIEDDLAHPLDTATAPLPRRHRQDDPPETMQPLDDRDPLYPIDTDDETPGMRRARIRQSLR